MNVGSFHLGQSIDSISSCLRELTSQEYRALPKTYKNEKIFHGGQVPYKNLFWDLIIGTVKGKIYKISLMIDISEYPESNLVLHDAFYNDLVREFGQPTERKSEFCIWDTDWGNIIYAQTKERFFALHFTSNSIAHNLSLIEIVKSLSFPLLAKLKRSFFWNLIDYTEEEIRRWLWLRAIEWIAWPTFILQPIVPVLFIFFTWWHVLVTLFLINVVWTFIRYRYVNFYLAQMGVFFVLLKWPASIFSCIYLLIERRYGLAILALLWPLVAGVIGMPGKVGKVELLLAKKIGYVSEDAEL